MSSNKNEDHNHSDLTYAMVASAPPRLAIDPSESSAIHLFTLAQLQALSSKEIFDVTRESAIFALEHTLQEWDSVPSTAWPA